MHGQLVLLLLLNMGLITIMKIIISFLVIIIEMSKPLVDSFDFEKFNEKIELIIIELRKKIEASKKDNDVEN